jgi:type III secretion protein D
MDSAVMARENNTPAHAHAIELRVFEGPQSGARAPLAAGTGFVLAANPHGHADDADVVLRDEGGAAARVRVTVDMHDALLEVLEGDVQLGDKKLAAGEHAPWAMHAPLKLGRSVVAFGRAAVANWPGALGAHTSAASGARGDAAGEAAHEDSTTAVKPRARTPLSRRPEVWLGALGAIVLVVCGGAFGVAQLTATPPVERAEAPSLAAQLRASEFSTLQATLRKDGQFEIRGRLETLQQRARLDAWLADKQLAPAIDVQVDEALARDVAETFRVNGVSVQANVLGTGIVAADAAERDAAKLARAEEVVRRDVRGITKLTVRSTLEPLPPARPPVPEDAGKRIASLVPGDPGYIVTADGSRYFVGSMLPTGHKIVDVGPSSVVLELDGAKTTLNF